MGALALRRVQTLGDSCRMDKNDALPLAPKTLWRIKKGQKVAGFAHGRGTMPLCLCSLLIKGNYEH